MRLRRCKRRAGGLATPPPVAKQTREGGDPVADGRALRHAASSLRVLGGASPSCGCLGAQRRGSSLYTR
eukprot:103281-Chlamydomonas_euryale.AAC.1